MCRFVRISSLIHMVNLRVLAELQSNDDPIWTYFDTHHKHILDVMNKSYRASINVVQGEPQGERNSHICKLTVGSKNPEN